MDVGENMRTETRHSILEEKKTQLLTGGCIFMHQSVDFRYLVFFSLLLRSRARTPNRYIYIFWINLIRLLIKMLLTTNRYIVFQICRIF